MKAEIDTVKIQLTMDEAEQMQKEIKQILNLIPLGEAEVILPEFPKVNELLKLLRIDPGIPF